MWWSTLVGAVGAWGMILSGSRIGSGPHGDSYRWWLWVPSGSYALAHVLFYVSFVLLAAGWLGVGTHALGGRLSVARAWGVLGLWGTPFFLGVPLFSRDVYSYAAQGQLLSRGLNPYLAAPRALGPGPLLWSVASVWRDTTSPYGPLFTELVHLISAVSGGSVIGEVMALRALELVGVGLLMVTLPILAQHFNVSAGVALWLAVLSPLALFSAVSSAHNDTLMLGVVALALLAWVREQRQWAFACFALAATIKLPALAGVAVLCFSALRSSRGRERVAIIFEATVIPALVMVAVTELVGLGWTWLSPAALRTPTELRVLITPMVSAGKFLSMAFQALGWPVASLTVVSATQHVGELLAMLLGLALLARVREHTQVRTLGLLLLLVVILSPTMWPWYFLWGLTTLAVTSAQRSVVLSLTAGLAMLLVGAGGTPMIGGNGVYVSGPAVFAGLGWFVLSRRWLEVLKRSDHVE